MPSFFLPVTDAVALPYNGASQNMERGGGGMCRWDWKLVGLCALALGAAILIVAIFPVGFLMILIACLLVFCGVGLLKKR